MASKNSAPKGSNPSGVPHTKFASVLGGVPPKKDKEGIEKANSPRANGSAPGSVRK